MTSQSGQDGWRYLPTDVATRETAAIDASLARFQCAIESVNGQSIPAALLAEALALIRSLADDSLAIRQRYDSLFDAVPDPVVVLDEHGILLDLNRAALASYRQPRESLIGVSIRQINPSLPANHLDLVWESLERGGTYVEQTSNRRADGSEFPVEVHSASFDDRGERRIVAVARDLTGRDRAERRYRQLLDTIDKGVLVQDTRGRPLSGNSAAYRILNIPAGWFPGRVDLRDWRLLDPEGRRIRLRDLPALRALRERRTIESTLVGVYRRREGDLRWISVTAVPQFERGRRDPIQVISLFSDVTELRRDYGLFQRAQSLARIGGWQWDRWRDRWYFTPQALALLGRIGEHDEDAVDSKSELLGLIHPDERLTLDASLHRMTSDGDPIRVDFRLCGEPTVWLRLTGEPEGSGPLAARIVGTIQDISEGKQAESELRMRAQSDNLTGLLNREGIHAELEARLRRAQPTGIALLYIDLDRFKIVNDLLGHAVGDEVLIGVARRMRRA
ncbi:MAG: PAS domain S-box protein, partial [Afipia sp.]|nr:PAS domain S-box protein [Afipia sp.]